MLFYIFQLKYYTAHIKVYLVFEKKMNKQKAILVNILSQ